MTLTSSQGLAWEKGMLPAIVQCDLDGTVLMTGYMNREALDATLASGHVTFFSRSKGRLWTKGESSGHYLQVREIRTDCDSDALVILAHAHGPTCHTGTRSCFGDAPWTAGRHSFLGTLEAIISARLEGSDASSYTRKLVAEGPRRVAQKVGEEGVEVALAAVMQGDEELLGESADLLFHLMVLLQSRGLSLADVVHTLEKRHASRS